MSQQSALITLIMMIVYKLHNLSVWFILHFLPKPQPHLRILRGEQNNLFRWMVLANGETISIYSRQSDAVLPRKSDACCLEQYARAAHGCGIVCSKCAVHCRKCCGANAEIKCSKQASAANEPMWRLQAKRKCHILWWRCAYDGLFCFVAIFQLRCKKASCLLHCNVV